MKRQLKQQVPLSKIAKKHNVSMDYLNKWFTIGSKIQSEHTEQKKARQTIASQHLDEDRKYYEKLTKYVQKNKSIIKQKLKQMVLERFLMTQRQALNQRQGSRDSQSGDWKKFSQGVKQDWQNIDKQRNKPGRKVSAEPTKKTTVFGPSRQDLLYMFDPRFKKFVQTKWPQIVKKNPNLQGNMRRAYKTFQGGQPLMTTKRAFKPVTMTPDQFKQRSDANYMQKLRQRQPQRYKRLKLKMNKQELRNKQKQVKQSEQRIKNLQQQLQMLKNKFQTASRKAEALKGNLQKGQVTESMKQKHNVPKKRRAWPKTKMTLHDPRVRKAAAQMRRDIRPEQIKEDVGRIAGYNRPKINEQGGISPMKHEPSQFASSPTSSDGNPITGYKGFRQESKESEVNDDMFNDQSDSFTLKDDNFDFSALRPKQDIADYLDPEQKQFLQKQEQQFLQNRSQPYPPNTPRPGSGVGKLGMPAPSEQKTGTKNPDLNFAVPVPQSTKSKKKVIKQNRPSIQESLQSIDSFMVERPEKKKPNLKQKMSKGKDPGYDVC